MTADSDGLARQCINTIRALSIDAIEAAKSGHPGAAMGLAPVGYTLWTRFLRHNPLNPDWPGRDRVVLSAGHASMLLYSLLYLTGYELSLEEVKNFRQLGSATPGHPEFGCAPGVEVTTGPLGQGVGMAVGMALARDVFTARFARPGFDPGDYCVYAICSDGDLMEGVAAEACSLAGHLSLGRLVFLFDDNHITIEGCTELTFTEDVPARFRAYGWEVIKVDDANDVESVASAIEQARILEGPVLVCIRSNIACGSPNLEGSEKSHGAPLGPEEARLTKHNMGVLEDETFHVTREVLDFMRTAVKRGETLEREWDGRLGTYETEHPEQAAEYRRILEGSLPEGWMDALPSFEPGPPLPTRSGSGKVLEALAPVIWELIGGSADLGPSNNTYVKGYDSIKPGSFSGRNIHFGVREHAMGAVMNGMARTGLIPYGGTFLVFSDYMRPAIRLAAMMKLHDIYVFTHDSLGVGEDGPTHQPVEQLAALRATPGLVVIRPADANETVEAWKVALMRQGPVALVLTRQAVPVLERPPLAAASGLARGAYILAGEHDPFDLLLIATGSEVSLALGARGELAKSSIGARVISMPSWELFEEQDAEYRGRILPREVGARLVIEAGVTMGWSRYAGDGGAVIGVDRFGVSASGSQALAYFGFTLENVVDKALRLLGRSDNDPVP